VRDGFAICSITSALRIILLYVSQQIKRFWNGVMLPQTTGMTGSMRRKPWGRWLGLVIAGALFLLLAGIGALYFRQHSMLYHPRSYAANYATALSPDGIELSFNTVAGKQTAFYLPRGEGEHLPKRIWVAFCGNGSLALDWTWLISRDQNSGDSFLLVDYPGYGKSAGYATIATTRAAADGALGALAAHLHVSQDQVESRLSVIGHSWGTAVALDFATRHPVQRAVLISAFTTLREEGATVVGELLSHVLIENYDNRACLRRLARRSPPTRVEIFHGTDDEVIPFRMGRELSEQFPAFVKFHPIEGADHVGVLEQAPDEILAAMND
jgi:uncharacterized protein